MHGSITVYVGNKLMGFSERDRVVNTTKATQNLHKEPKRERKMGIERIMIKGKHLVIFRHNRGGSFPYQ